MYIHNLSQENSILKSFISEIRNVNVQNDRMRFRRNIERIGEILGYEMSKVLNYSPIKVEYLACPNLANKTLILADPMLATGKSMVTAFEALKPFGKPKSIHLVSTIGAQEGVDFVESYFSKDTHLWIATVDESLNEKGYIVPGLGDAGDLSFGQKLQH